MKYIQILFVICAFVMSLPFAYADSLDYAIRSVYVNGIAADGSLVEVPLGTTLQVQVYLEGTGEKTDVRLHAWLGGYEYGDIDATSDVFTVEDGVSYKKYLYLEIPDDLDVLDHTYTLHVEIYDSEDREEEIYTIYFAQERHDIVIEDILLSSSTLAPEDYLAVKVRLENQGYIDEEDLKITVSIPELGISNRVYMDELFSGDQDTASAAYLLIPSSASGTYEVLVHVDYNNDYSTVEERTYILVSGELVYDENTFVSVSSLTNLMVGEESRYKVQVTNLGESTKTFYLTVEGLDAEYTPQLTIPAGSSGEFVFILHPEETGVENVFIEVSTDEGLVIQKLYTVEVQEKNYTGAIALFVVLGVILFVQIYFLLRKRK